MSQLTQTILQAAHSLPEGGLLSPKEFLHLSSRAAVDQALTRLVKDGTLLRVGRGAYALPVKGRFGARPPSTAALVEGLAHHSGELIAPSGAAEASALGLTTQVPVREIFITSGASRTLQLAGRSVEFQHAKRWQFVLGNRPAGSAVRALAWFGEASVQTKLIQIKGRLSTAEWQAIVGARAAYPSWMARAVGAAAHG